MDSSCHFSLDRSSPEPSSFSGAHRANLSAGGSQHGPMAQRGAMLSYTSRGSGPDWLNFLRRLGLVFLYWQEGVWGMWWSQSHSRFLKWKTTHIIWSFLRIITASCCAFQDPVGQRTIHVANKSLRTPDPGDGAEPGGLSAETILFEGWAQSGEVSWCARAMSWHLVERMLHSLPLS